MPKKFDKKNAVTYRLVHRSQRDPLMNDETASSLVLMPVKGNGPNIFHEEFQETEYPSAEEDSFDGEEFEEQGNGFGDGLEEVEETVQIDPKKDASNFGIYFKSQDDYDYMKHLKVIGEDPSAVFIDNTPKEREKKSGIEFVEDKLNEAEIFGSKDEMEVGLMNQEPTMGLQLDLDPSVREAFVALDDEAYIEDLDDDFFDAFHQEQIPEKFQQMQVIPEDEEVEEFEEQDQWIHEFKKFQKSKEQYDSDEDYDDEDRAGTTQFSMSSSAMFRNDKLTLLDDQFDKILADYSDEEIGELDPEDDELQGDYAILDPNFQDEHLDEMFDSFLENLHVIGQKRRVVTRDPNQSLDAIRRELKEDAKELVEKYAYVEDEVEKPIMMPEAKKRDQWDVESVLSLHSNIYNRPKIIREISKTAPKIRFKKGIPVVEEQEQVSDEESESDEERVNKGAARNANETKEEKRARKEAIKQERKDRRQSKKNLKTAFKVEKDRQTKLLPNQKLQGRSVPL